MNNEQEMDKFDLQKNNRQKNDGGDFTIIYITMSLMIWSIDLFTLLNDIENDFLFTYSKINIIITLIMKDLGQQISLFPQILT